MTPDIPSTIGAGGRRIWLYPADVRGPFRRYRRLTAWLLFLVYLGIPWLNINGRPFLRLDLEAGNLALAGHLFWPQDLRLFLPLAIALIITVFAITSLYGRIWCGWACPQTVFLHFLFRPIERALEGNAAQRRKRDAAGISYSLVLRKALKHSIYIAISSYIAVTFLGYFTGMDTAWSFFNGPPDGLTIPVLFLVVFCILFYFNFAWFREQACILVCPYARFQTVLTDEKTLNIGYDSGRGEKRGNPRKKKNEKLGDCIDCGYCVRACPTGIDIRNGLQLECTGCTGCIDACNSVMRAWKRPEGLIRYASQEQLSGKPHKILRPRVFTYLALTAALLLLFSVLLSTRTLISVDMIRKGTLAYFPVGQDSVANIFSLAIRNKSVSPVTCTLAFPDLKGRSNIQNKKLTLQAGALKTYPVNIIFPAMHLKEGRKSTTLKVTGEKDIIEHPVVLLGPQ